MEGKSSIPGGSSTVSTVLVPEWAGPAISSAFLRKELSSRMLKSRPFIISTARRLLVIGLCGSYVTCWLVGICDVVVPDLFVDRVIVITGAFLASSKGPFGFLR